MSRTVCKLSRNIIWPLEPFAGVWPQSLEEVHVILRLIDFAIWCEECVQKVLAIRHISGGRLIGLVLGSRSIGPTSICHLPKKNMH